MSLLLSSLAVLRVGGEKSQKQAADEISGLWLFLIKWKIPFLFFCKIWQPACSRYAWACAVKKSKCSCSALIQCHVELLPWFWRDRGLPGSEIWHLRCSPAGKLYPLNCWQNFFWGSMHLRFPIINGVDNTDLGLTSGCFLNPFSINATLIKFLAITVATAKTQVG